MIPEGVSSSYCIIPRHFQLDQVSILQELTFNSQCLPCSAPSVSDQPPFTSVKQFTNSLLISTNLAQRSTEANFTGGSAPLLWVWWQLDHCRIVEVCSFKGDLKGSLRTSLSLISIVKEFTARGYMWDYFEILPLVNNKLCSSSLKGWLPHYPPLATSAMHRYQTWPLIWGTVFVPTFAECRVGKLVLWYW